MASLSLLLLSAALIHNAQPLPADRVGGRGLDLSVGGVRRQRRDLRNLLPFEDQRGGGANDLYYQSDDWRGRGLDHALQRLVEKDQRREQEEEQRAAYLAALLRLLSEAEKAGLVGPGEVEVVQVEDEEDDEGPEPPDYDETGRGLNMGRPPALWWALLDRMEPRLVQKLLDRARQERLQQDGRMMSREQDELRHLVAKILSSIGPNDASGRRMRRDLSAGEPVSSAHRRTRRSLDDVPVPSPSNDPPLLRVKRLEDDEDEQKLRPYAGLQRMKRIDAMATADELNHGSRRRRRAALNYDPQELLDQMVQYLRD